MFQIKNVTCRYEEQTVFESVSVDIKKGQYVILMGENGQGKSTFIDLITGYKKANQGSVLFEGQSLNRLLKDNSSKHYYYARLGIIFQDVDIQLFNQTVYDEVAFGLRQLGLDKETIKIRVEDVLKLLKIEQLVKRVPYQLSGGEKKKVALASILVMNPDVYIMDEPFNNLAREADHLFKEIFSQLHQAGKTIIMSSHHFKHVHDKQADVLLFRQNGVTFFPASEVNHNPEVRDLLSHY